MADGKRPRDEESSAPPRGLPRVCRDLFRGGYFLALSSLIRLRILLSYVFDNYRVMERVPSMGPGAWIVGQGGIGLSGGLVASSSSSSNRLSVRDDGGVSAAAASGSALSSATPPAPVITAP
jgi:hypothetical protein